jgi:hypothetical protein
MRTRFAVVVLMTLLACGEVREEIPRADTIPLVVPDTQRRALRPGVRFDPALLQPGARVGELIVQAVDVHQTAVDSSHVGTVRFIGAIELSGLTLRHPDADLANVALCFEADSTSASRLPRWSGDERRPWFCFENRAEAARALGAPSEGVSATLVVERFTIHRSLSDAVNSARFVRLLRGGRMSSRPPG